MTHIVEKTDTDRRSLNPTLVARVLGAVALALVLASLGLQLMVSLTGHAEALRLLPLFSLDAEKNVPSYFSAFLLLCSAILLAVITVREKRRAGTLTLYWAILSLGFLLMAVDEALSFHERLVQPLRDLFGTALPSAFHFAWVIPGIAVVLLLAVFFTRFLMRIPTKTRNTFLLAGALYLGGAIGFEMIGGNYVASYGVRDLPYYLIATIEETLEMAGVIVFIWALLTYIAEEYTAT